MEAVALYDFQGSRPDELSFSEGDRVSTLDVEGENGWVFAVKGPHSGFVPQTYIEWQPHKWLCPCNNRDEARDLLLEKTTSGSYIHLDGAFMVRNSKDKFGYSLSVKNKDSVIHYKIIKHDQDNQFYIWQDKKFLSINGLVSNYHFVNLSNDSSHPMLLKDIEPVYEALYDFQASGPEELELTAGDIIRSANMGNDGWGEGAVADMRGLFPINRVHQIHPGTWNASALPPPPPPAGALASFGGY